MSGMGKNKLVGLTVIGLAILNIALLTFIWFNSGSKKRTRPNREGMVFLEQQLNLSSEQQTKLEELRNSHFKKMEGLTHASREARQELHDLWGKEVTEAEIKSLTMKIGDLQSQIEEATFYHFADMRKIFTEDQAEEFDGLIKDVLSRGERRGPMPGGVPPNDGNLGGKPPRKPGS